MNIVQNGNSFLKKTHLDLGDTLQDPSLVPKQALVGDLLEKVLHLFSTELPLTSLHSCWRISTASQFSYRPRSSFGTQ